MLTPVDEDWQSLLMGYLAPNNQRKKIRTKAKNPDHEAAGLTQRHYGMKGELLSAKTPEGNKIGGGDALAPPSSREVGPPPAAPSGSGPDASVAGNPLSPPAHRENKPSYMKSGLDDYYAKNPHLKRLSPMKKMKDKGSMMKEKGSMMKKMAR